MYRVIIDIFIQQDRIAGVRIHFLTVYKLDKTASLFFFRY